MSCSCGCSPCCCPTAGEVDPSECLDPGITKTSAYASVFNEDMCPRRLVSFRGLKDDGSPDTNPSSALRAAVLIQDALGDVRWSESPCNDPPEFRASVVNDAQAADPTNYVPSITAKNTSDCDVALVGSSDTASGNWKLVWVASLQKWTTVPDTGEGGTATDLCTSLETGLVIDPGTEEYVLEVSSTTLMALGVSIKVGQYEFVVTEIIDGTYVRAELITTITSPASLPIGENVCNIGFRPCPRATAPYADNIVTCLGGSPVAVEFPDDVNNTPVPGLWWRDQLGRVVFIPVPVDSVTGVVKPNYILKTPANPGGSAANQPSFSLITQKPTWLVSKVVVGSKFVGTPSAPSFAIEDDVVSVSPHSGSFNMAGGSIPGYVAGSSVAIVRAMAYTDSGLGGTEALAQVQANGLVLIESWIDSATNFASQTGGTVFEVPLTNDAFTYALVAAGDALAFAKLEVIGFK
jgi:hypothetical protein